MRCFYHPDREAVAVCRMCARGLCADCGESIGRGLACRGECAEWGRDYEGLLDEAIRNYRLRAQQQKQLDEKKRQAAAAPATSEPQVLVRAPGPTMRERAEAYREVTVSQAPRTSSSPPWNNGILLLIIGIALLIWGAFDWEESLFILLLGTGFAAYGLFRLGIGRGQRSNGTRSVSGNESR
jgi:hypothetical protein